MRDWRADVDQRRCTLRARVAALVGVIGLVGLSASPLAVAAPPPDQLALTTLNNIVQGDDNAVTAQFDATMKNALSSDALGQAWTSYQQTLGAYQSHGDPEDVQRGDITVVNVPLQMQNEPGQFRLSVHPDGTIAGLYFLRAGVPVP
jgi:hypothetical protein